MGGSQLRREGLEENGRWDLEGLPDDLFVHRINDVILSRANNGQHIKFRP